MTLKAFHQQKRCFPSALGVRISLTVFCRCRSLVGHRWRTYFTCSFLLKRTPVLGQLAQHGSAANEAKLTTDVSSKERVGDVKEVEDASRSEQNKDVDLDASQVSTTKKQVTHDSTRHLPKKLVDPSPQEHGSISSRDKDVRKPADDRMKSVRGWTGAAGPPLMLVGHAGWETARALHRSLGPISATVDAVRLVLASRRDHGVGRNVARTGASIAGSWAGAAAGGAAGAHIGALAGLALGPVGVAVGTLTGGLVGTVAGALGLGKLTEKGVDKLIPAEKRSKDSSPTRLPSRIHRIRNRTGKREFRPVAYQ